MFFPSSFSEIWN